jgi:hypothetical protein
MTACGGERNVFRSVVIEARIERRLAAVLAADVVGLIFALPELASRLANVSCVKRNHRLADGLAQASGLIPIAPP